MREHKYMQSIQTMYKTFVQIVNCANPFKNSQ
jgi:hypothetical protein